MRCRLAGRYRLAARRRADRVEVEIADNGVGMRAEVLARVFEPYFTTKGERGTGLGLAMVFGIIGRHGGRITASSSPGHGSVFLLSFPFAPRAAQGPTAAAASIQRTGIRVLAVDDELALVDMLSRMLRLLGHTPTMARSAEAALELLARESFDVLISDVGMGTGMNGWDLADQVRQRWPELPIVLATGWGGGIDESDARARGMDSILSKPYRMIDLRRVIEAASAGKERGAADPTNEGTAPLP